MTCLPLGGWFTVPSMEVLTISTSVPAAVLDSVLTAVEASLHDAGASQVWIEPASAGLTVMAELPPDPGAAT